MKMTWKSYVTLFKRIAILLLLLTIIQQWYAFDLAKIKIAELESQISLINLKADTAKELDDCPKCCHKMFGYVHVENSPHGGKQDNKLR